MEKQKLRGQYSYGSAMGKYGYFKKKEKKFKMALNCGKLYVIRFDGKDMTHGFKIKHKAINELFFETMKLTFKNFAKKYEQIIFGYSFSDEISILFKAANDDKMFLRGAKLLSLMSGQLALEFYKAAQITKLDCRGRDWIFDARLIAVEQPEVIGYFKARQAFAIDKFLSQCRTEYGVDYSIKKSDEIIAKLKEKEVDYADFPPEYKYGLMYVQGKLIEPFELVDSEEKFTELCFGKSDSDKKVA